MKTFKLTVLLLLSPLVFYAQTLTGLWVGSVTNDSVTVRKDQSFEIVLTQYKNKVYGFSRSTFIVNDSLFYIVKRVKGTIEDNVCEVKDDEIVSYNFKGRLNKNVKVTTTFRFDKGDSTWRMDGDWKTNQTKKYYSVSGKATLNQEKDLTKSKILPHLEELKLADDVAFYKESKKEQEQIATAKQPAKENNNGQVALSNKSVGTETTKAPATVAAVEPEPPSPIVVKRSNVKNDHTEIASIDKNNNVTARPKSQPSAEAKQVPVEIQKPSQPAIEERTNVAATQNNRQNNVAASQSKATTVAQTTQPVNNNKSQPIVKEEPKKTEQIAIAKAPEQKKEQVAETAKPETKKQETVAVETPKEKPQNVSVFAETKPVNGSAALQVTERKTAAPQVVNYKSDSLVLALYDNGEVDGDTVSVLLNDQIIIAKECLKVSAIKKTIYVPKDDSFTLTLYAENLGKYPPNTGLLIVYDGNDSYQIRFSADLQQNAAVIFKRKRN